MKANAAALPRLLTKRRHWKPPSQWTVLLTILMADALGFIVQDLVRMERGNWTGAFFIPIWTLLYACYRWRRALQNRLEKDAEAVVAPPSYAWWVIVGWVTAMQILGWILLTSAK